MESLKDLQTLRQLLDLGFRRRARDFVAQALNFFTEFDLTKQSLDRFCTHFGVEFVTEFFNGFVILFVSQQLTNVERGHTRLGHYE